MRHVETSVTHIMVRAFGRLCVWCFGDLQQGFKNVHSGRVLRGFVFV